MVRLACLWSPCITGVNMTTTNRLRLIRLAELLLLLACSRSTVYLRLDPKSPYYDPSFPRPIKLSGHANGRGAVAWVESEVEAWIAERMAARA
ncbi:AlpA family phage regulatory protein [uncultured Dechloromonas sp.]|uniref:helix-turn-helix transcriptional regulator n=1 Tax=uncultured Dechloromonas sp. TaxID=171719 RepID=UPI003445E2F1